jgi:capsular polysaccharide biosynthesis protein
MAEDLQKIVQQYNPAKWHAMLSRRSRLEKFAYWYRKPRGTVVRTLEILSFKAPLLSRLFTDNSVVNMGITFERIFHFLAHNTKIGPLLVFSKRPCFLLSHVNVELRNSFIRLHSGHLLSPFKSDRQFMSGMYIDELHRLAISTDQKLHRGCYFVLPKQDFYFHFLIEFLPRIVESKIAFPEIEVITTSDQPNFVYEALALVKVPLQKSSELILNLEFVFVAEETHRLSQTVSHRSLKDLQVPLETTFPIGIAENSSELHLLLTRKGQPRYNEKLERELFTPLIDIGFLVVDPRELSLAQQILLFRRTKVLVGFHGGAMSNMVFMPERSQVFEIYAEGYDGFNPEFFRELASSGNHKYRTYSKTNSVTLESIIKDIRANV